MFNWKLAAVALAVSVALGLLMLAATEHAAHKWFPDVSFPEITTDIWAAMRDVINAIADALAQAITAPFRALSSTLQRAGVPVWFAWGVAVVIILVAVAGILTLLAKLGGWL